MLTRNIGSDPIPYRHGMHQDTSQHLWESLESCNPCNWTVLGHQSACSTRSREILPVQLVGCSTKYYRKNSGSGHGHDFYHWSSVWVTSLVLVMSGRTACCLLLAPLILEMPLNCLLSRLLPSPKTHKSKSPEKQRKYQGSRKHQETQMANKSACKGYAFYESNGHGRAW